MLFILLVALSALFVAGCAAFFSIKGLIVLFSGSALAIGIMASSLEVGKLVAASFLHARWKKINLLLKLYLCIAVFVLMCITSLGIFGFLTGAYQVHSAKVGTFDTKIAALATEKTSIEEAMAEYSGRIKTLTEVRATQEQRVQAAGNYKAPRDQAYKAIAEANEEIQKKEEDVSKGRARAIELEKEMAELKISLNTTTDVGSFKFIADALNTDVDTSVRYFIFALIAVFDPLALSLVLAWNNLLENRGAAKKKEDVEPEKIPFPVLTLPAKQEVAFVSASAPTVALKQPEVKKEVPFKPFKKEIKQKEAPLDIVSNMPLGDVSAKAVQLSEEQRKAELAKRNKSAGNNDSIVTNG